MRTTDWVVVIPVKGTPQAKSRMDPSPGLALAIALDTVEAALAAADVLVVTSASAAESFEDIGARVVIDEGGGLNDAASHGLAVENDGNRAVLLGDLPALQPDELTEALEMALRFPRAFVPDTERQGTSLITARTGVAHRPAFGTGSRAAHQDRGYVELDVNPQSGLRRDVDTRTHLREIPPARLGSRTRRILEEYALLVVQPR
ncbi:2-phospho-L-lactate guanylyltransferase [Mycetocola sp.]|uniref:2-phospho-L-lactate guanylyltransferase n=1 Tax=Mycetocola sp. TaxID=1871042 RepID=UPI00398A0CBE